jgi:hypothetical protein
MSDEIDLSAVSAEIEKLTPEQIKEKLLSIKTRQKIQQKKQAGKGGQKAYQQKQAALRKTLKEKAIQLGIYDEIDEAATKAAEEAVAADESNDEESAA